MIVSVVKILLIIAWSAFVASLELLFVPFHRTGKLFHALARWHSRWALAIAGVHIIVEGLEHLDFSRSYIYVSNHASLFDIPAVLAGVPDQIRIVYKKELEKIPIFGWGLKYGKTYISVNRSSGSDAIRTLEEAAQKIRHGASVLLFAEGTRSPDGKLQQFKRGAFSLAVRAGVPVVPLAINGSYTILKKKSLRINSGTITLVLSAPIEPPSADGKESEFLLRDEVRRAIEQNYRNQ
ncbi:MAG: 1-acyl-sn-glycerol-3-phosphate acyltransferase [Ignavibacteriae bacterium]|nr:1-acyl-sn-glycerol-3-phosphate acyltransferase [Ignavibacteria bacterium]MBI3364205.1 1-acyl-sn-glycerol-3-phosphate acyltransferase [Ignavibacteriota bacterium]